MAREPMRETAKSKLSSMDAPLIARDLFGSGKVGLQSSIRPVCAAFDRWP